MNRQKTISKSVTVSGAGLFSGKPCRMKLTAAPAQTGIIFVRNDLPTPVRIACDIANLAKRPRRTTLTNGAAAVETVEHVLAAAMGLGIDNLIIEMDGEESPSADGSPMMFVEAMLEAGIEQLDSDRRMFVIDAPISVCHGDTMLAALPGPSDWLEILYDLDYSDIPGIGRQIMSFKLGADDFVADIAPARTFALEHEANELQKQGLCRHLRAGDILVMGPDGPLDNELRFPDEHVRHKICDLIGDLALLGVDLRGRLVAYKSGHELNHSLVQQLSESIEADRQSEEDKNSPIETLMDIRQIMRLLPHRYPFLMVDRIIQIDGDRRAVGLKNVSINEPYFQGHYPGQPIMPGVMTLEAMAQLSGILLGRRLEHTGKVAVLLSMDRVKMRRPVRPGDQLILEAEAIHIRSRTGHCRCRARVGDEIAAEAEIKFMLVDAEPI